MWFQVSVGDFRVIWETCSGAMCLLVPLVAAAPSRRTPSRATAASRRTNLHPRKVCAQQPPQRNERRPAPEILVPLGQWIFLNFALHCCGGMFARNAAVLKEGTCFPVFLWGDIFLGWVECLGGKCILSKRSAAWYQVIFVNIFSGCRSTTPSFLERLLSGCVHHLQLLARRHQVQAERPNVVRHSIRINKGTTWVWGLGWGLMGGGCWG